MMKHDYSRRSVTQLPVGDGPPPTPPTVRMSVRDDSAAASKVVQGFELDRTLIHFGLDGATPTVNYALFPTILANGNSLRIVTDQRAISVTPLGGPRITVNDFLANLLFLETELMATGITISAVHVSLFHAKAAPTTLHILHASFRHRLPKFGLRAPISIYVGADSPKPSPLMLHIAGITRYYGAGAIDRMAAASAGIEFVHVDFPKVAP